MEHRIRPRPVKMIIELNNHDLRCTCRMEPEIVQIRSRLDDFGTHMARYDGHYEARPYPRAPDRVYMPVPTGQGALGPPAPGA